jgi:hypothetical protein
MISGLDESDRMKSAYFTIHPGKHSPPQNGCWLKSVFFLSYKSTGFTSSTFPIQPDFSQNQPAAMILNTGSPQTLLQIRSTIHDLYNTPLIRARKPPQVFMGEHPKRKAGTE